MLIIQLRYPTSTGYLSRDPSAGFSPKSTPHLHTCTGKPRCAVWAPAGSVTTHTTHSRAGAGLGGSDNTAQDVRMSRDDTGPHGMETGDALMGWRQGHTAR